MQSSIGGAGSLPPLALVALEAAQVRASDMCKCLGGYFFGR